MADQRSSCSVGTISESLVAGRDLEGRGRDIGASLSSSVTSTVAREAVAPLLPFCGVEVLT